MNHHASPDFWACYRNLPASVQELAGKSFGLLKADPGHPPLHFKKVGRFWFARVGLHRRAVKAADGLVWFWIGAHAEDDRLVD